MRWVGRCAERRRDAGQQAMRFHIFMESYYYEEEPIEFPDNYLGMIETPVAGIAVNEVIIESVPAMLNRQKRVVYGKATVLRETGGGLVLHGTFEIGSASRENFRDPTLEARDWQLSKSMLETSHHEPLL